MEPEPGFADAQVCSMTRRRRDRRTGREGVSGSCPATYYVSRGEGSRNRIKNAPHPGPSQFTVDIYHSRSHCDQALLSSLFSSPPEILRKYPTFQ